MKGQKTLFSHKSDEWETPQALFDELDYEFDFNFNPCASENNHKTKDFLTIKQDGLTFPWGGLRVFVNPPYSNITAWAEKCYYEILQCASVIVLLVPARTDTKWFHKYIYKQSNVEIRFIKGRLKFGDSKNSAPFPSMVVVFRRLNQ
jgi:phage N-6-adenine-methyltransferase